MKMKLENQVVRILEDHKAYDIKKVNVESITPFATYYVVASVLNLRALGATADALEDELSRVGYEVKAKDGKPETGWIVVVVEDVTIHLFLPNIREEIALEDMIAFQAGRAAVQKA